ncbi:hypothetical protein [Methylobacterium sp. E-045]|uniref:hypothetical protein n=1 Tax=Methylobacterium sp. E-045 TaxID=2836575 RepID=UPI001FB8A5B6|nr:hypothetical protein [Methylobacterium sp. E-045]MCJ2127408.1 hypothetical protein [Methylobacterium sp. E-045]
MINKTHLPSDATLADVVPNLEEADAYLSRLLTNMRFCQKRHGNASVRIAVTGKGGHPSYRVDYVKPVAPDPDGTAFDAYGGKAHYSFTAINIMETNWSSRSMTLDEVLKLQAELRKPKFEAR